MRVEGNPECLGDGNPLARSRGRAPVGGLGDEVLQKLKVFRKICVQNLVKSDEYFLKIWQFRKQYILFVVRLPTSEKRHVSYIFCDIWSTYTEFLAKNACVDIAICFVILSCSLYI